MLVSCWGGVLLPWSVSLLFMTWKGAPPRVKAFPQDSLHGKPREGSHDAEIRESVILTTGSSLPAQHFP